jgi:hypothetical protein
MASAALNCVADWLGAGYVNWEQGAATQARLEKFTTRLESALADTWREYTAANPSFLTGPWFGALVPLQAVMAATSGAK